MAVTVEVIEIGDSLGIVLRREVLEKLRVDVDDTLYLTATSRGMRLTRNPPDVAGKSEDADQFMREDRDVPNRLAE